jgi:nucleoside-diphosphate-sugar epimerase
LNVLRQAKKAGVKKFVVTSSIITMTGDSTVKGTAYRSERRLFLFCVLTWRLSKHTLSLSTDWSPITKEDGLNSDEKKITYAASKKYAELAVWEWAEAHPDVDVTTSKVSIIIFFPFFPSKNFVLNSSPTLHLRSIRTQVSSTSEA